MHQRVLQDETRPDSVGPRRPQLLVALGGRGEEDAALVRAAHRQAQREGVHWWAVHVDNGRAGPRQRLALDQVLALVNRLGGEVRVLQGVGRARELHEYAMEQGAATLMVGRTRPSGWRFWRRPLAERLLRYGGAYDLVVVAEARQRRRFRPVRRRNPLGWREGWVVAGSFLVAVGVAWALEFWLELANLSLIFLAAVLASATLAGTRAAMITAALGFLAFNFLFTRPRFSLAMVEREQLLTVIFFLLVAVVVGQLAGSGRQRLVALRSSREQSHRLLTFSRALSVATDREQVRDAGVSTLERWLGVPVVFLDDGGQDGSLSVRSAIPANARLGAVEEAAAAWSWQQRKPSGAGTATQASLRWRFIPLVEQERMLGIVGLELAVRERPLGPDQETLVTTLTRQLGMALERTRLVAELGASRLSEENERLRSALLSSVSHDLRTPLASIIGSASSLRELEPQLSRADRRELLDGILAESERLNRYIQNLLDMTRLGHGDLKIERDWVSFDDLVTAALKRLGATLDAVRVEREGANGLPLLYVHPALIEQALVNVLDNAVRFSPADGQVGIRARLDEAREWLEIRITDEGPGIPPEQREAVFDMFFTGGEGDRGRHGSGLGLAICRGMLGAHGGSVEALPGPAGQGTTIVMRLPLAAQEEHANDGD
ncbi:ATP-binding protein [Halomonas sp. LR3S48]|uniref:ATP-binding protein n=1 Tax=Halomonas sp. LR3S48 TaxID=2982694 RepID=UPI0021E43D52|nr:ATP-binding protein [Halomonas sp. LR3S48]UYG05097.1 ATP-binding protein [Halomonas sp. LR3S48]